MESVSWDDLRVLLAIHRAGSLLKAGRILGISTSTTGRRLDALERAVGAKLVHRTQVGADLTASAVQLVRLAERFEQELVLRQRDQGVVAGTIRISVPDGLAPIVAEALVPLYGEYPAVDVELIGESRMSDVSKREVDIALRLARSPSHFLIEKKVAAFRFSLFGSAEYVRRHLAGKKLHEKDAGEHAFIGLDPRWPDLPQEQWLVRLGASRFVFRSNSIEAVMSVVTRGLGLAALPDKTGGDAGLVRIETEIAGPEQPLYMVYHRDLRDAAHIRAAVKLIQAMEHLFGSDDRFTKARRASL